MKVILKLEEIGMFLVGLFFFYQLDFAWWWFWALLLTPDIGMLGYVVNNKIGATLYNIFHHKGLAVMIGIIGFYLVNQYLMLAGVILFSHAAFDRIMGYGLKYNEGFKFTHLGEIGK